MFAQRLRELRRECGLTQIQLAQKFNVSNGTIGMWETGKREPDFDTTKRLAAFFHVSVDYLVGNVNDPFFHLDADRTLREINSYEDEDTKATLSEKKWLRVGTESGEYNKSTKAPPYSDEAMKLAKDYTGLDFHGKRMVQLVVDEEKARMETEEVLMKVPAAASEPKVINLFVEPSAAGIVAPTVGRDYEFYTLKPDDPPGAAYAVRLQGDSMEPDFPDGSIVFVNHDALRDGDVGIFSVDGGTVCKQYHQEGGMVYLFSLNRRRADADLVLFPGGNRSFVCQGRVITRRRYPVPGRG